MATCVPIKDMRDTAAFLELVKNSPEPITVTKNGYDELVVMRSEDYAEIKRAEAYHRLMARMAIAEQERAAGVTYDAFALLDELEGRYA